MKFDMKVIGYLTLISQIGLNMAIPIFGSIFLGNWIDRKLEAHGIILILFILMGVYMSFRYLFTIVMKKIDTGKKDSKR
jgi:ATP synthase protein I